jgi:hypothetical protein
LGIEPSAILGFRDEYPDLVPTHLKEAAKSLAKHALLLDEFIARSRFVRRDRFHRGESRKALAGGMYPVSMFLATEEVMGAIKPGDRTGFGNHLLDKDDFGRLWYLTAADLARTLPVELQHESQGELMLKMLQLMKRQ